MDGGADERGDESEVDSSVGPSSRSMLSGESGLSGRDFEWISTANADAALEPSISARKGSMRPLSEGKLLCRSRI